MTEHSDPFIEEIAIYIAEGNNGGEWAEHYTDEQKNTWRTRAEMLVSKINSEYPESTRFADKHGNTIHVGDYVKKAVTGNTDIHGTWAVYLIRKAPGGYIFSFAYAEKGSTLPPDYTAGYMMDHTDMDAKTLVFATQALVEEGWELVKYDPPDDISRWDVRGHSSSE